MKTINKFLSYYLNQKIKFEIISFILNLIIFTILYLFILIQIEYYFYLIPSIKNNIIKLSYITISTAFIFLFLKVIIHKFGLFGNSNKQKIADELSKKIATKDRIINALQIYSHLDEKNPYNDLSKKAINDVELELKKVDIKNINFYYDFKKIYIILVILIGFFIYTKISENYYASVNRLINKNIVFIKPTPFKLKFNTNLKKIFKGDSYKIKVEGIGKLPNQIDLYWIANDSINNKKIMLKNNEYVDVLNHINADLKVWAQYKNKTILPFNKYNIMTDTLNIKTKKRPKIKNLEIIIIPPSYTKKQSKKHNNAISHINVMKGSTLKITGLANQEIKFGNITFENDSIINIKINNNIISYDFLIDNQQWFELFYQDYNGDLSLGIQYFINIIEDKKPKVSIYKPITDLKINDDHKIDILYEIIDDHGLSKAILEYQIVKPYYLEQDTLKYEIIIFNPKKLTNYENLNYLWNLKNLKLRPGDKILYQIKALDNNVLKIGIGKSELLKAYFPSLEELFFEVEEEQENITDAFEYITDSMDELKNIYKEITDEVLKEQMGWEQVESTNEMLAEINDITDKMQGLEKTIESIEELNDKNDLVNDILGDKIQKLQEMFKKAISPELMDALQNLQNAINKEQMKDAINELNKLDFEMKDLETQLDRMIELFEELVIEQKLDELIVSIEQMSLYQKDITSIINKNKSDPNIETMNKQQNNNLETLNININQASDLIKKNDAKISQKLNNINNSKDFKAIKNNIDNISNKVSPKKNSLNAEENIASIDKELREVIDSYNKKNTVEMLNMYSRIIKNLIDMSYEQESVTKQSYLIKTKNDSLLKTIKLNQNILLEQYKNLFIQISELSKKSFYIKSDISKSYSLVFTNLTKSINAFEQGNINIGKKYQGLVMRHLNQTALLFLEAMKEMQDSDSPSGYNEYLEKMQQLSEGQQSLNKGMEGIMPMPFGQQPGNQGLIESLMKQQQQLMQELQKLMEGSSGKGGEGKNGTELGDAIQDMEDNIKDLQNNNINQESIERGEKIYQKLLNHSKALKNKGEKEEWKTDKIENNLEINNKILEIESQYNKQINELYKTLDDVQNNQKINYDNKKIIEEYLKILINEKINEKK
jgi:hypothetical protein